MKHRWKVNGEQVITLQMAQQLKTKNTNLVTRQLFCCQGKTELTVFIIKIYKKQVDCLKDS